MTSAAQTKISFYLPIKIIARHTKNGEIMAGPLRGELFNISKNEACLLMSQVMHNKYHFFYSTQENNLLSLQILIEPVSNFEGFKISARPLWFNLFQQGRTRNFIMGVEFFPDFGEKKRRALLATIKRHQKKIK